MSSVPNANRSVVTNVHVFPDSFHSYPQFNRSNVQSCSFAHLDTSSQIDRSRLLDTNVSADTRQRDSSAQIVKGRSTINRSDLVNTDLEQVEVGRSRISRSSLQYAQVNRSAFSKVRAVGISSKAQVRVERCRLANSDLTGRCNLSRTTVADALLHEVKADRSTIASSYISSTKLDAATIASCDVADCKIDSTNFSNKFIRNGIWERGTLVGRIDPSREVVVKDLSEMQPVDIPPRQQLEMPRGILRHTSSPGPSAADLPADLEKQAMSFDEKPLLQHADSHLSSLDRYDGPDLDALPPYQA